MQFAGMQPKNAYFAQDDFWETRLEQGGGGTKESQKCGGEGKGAQCPGRRTTGGAKKSQKCRKYYLQYRPFASERPQVRTCGR